MPRILPPRRPGDSLGVPRSGRPAGGRLGRSSRASARIGRVSEPTDAPGPDADLRADIRRLGDHLGSALVRQEGPELLALVEQVRGLVRTDPARVAALLESVDLPTAIRLARAFSTYFHLANVAEQVHRARGIRLRRTTEGGRLADVGRRIAEQVESGQPEQKAVGAAVER